MKRAYAADIGMVGDEATEAIECVGVGCSGGFDELSASPCSDESPVDDVRQFGCGRRRQRSVIEVDLVPVQAADR